MSKHSEYNQHVVPTTSGEPISRKLISSYFKRLINQFYKILPMSETNEESLPVYLDSLLVELLGCSELINEIGNDALYLVLVNTVKYMINHPDCPRVIIRREIFKSINICNKFVARYTEVINQ